jgi:micrococcal nuclease
MLQKDNNHQKKLFQDKSIAVKPKQLTATLWHKYNKIFAISIIFLTLSCIYIFLDKNIYTEQNIIVNHNYDTGDNTEAQDINQTIKANKEIINNDNNTKYTKLLKVIAVIDGDTIKVNDLGIIRLIGIDTPETRDTRKPIQCYGEEASNKAKELLDNQEVYLEFDPANRIDKYGRTLAYIYRKDGLFYNAEMIKQGYANSYTKFPHPKLEEFNGYQKEARDNNRGLWSPNTCNGDTSKAVAERLKAELNIQSSQYILGDCDVLNAKGMGNFTQNNPNYRLSRDKDKDGIACEMN